MAAATATVPSIAEYDPSIFNAIPDLEVAVTSFVAAEAEEALNKVGSLFVEHNCWNKYGLILVHRHFEMQPNEILVETFNNGEAISVAMPWTLSEDGSASPSDMALWNSYSLTHETNVHPYSWAFIEEKLQPYEFLSFNGMSTEAPSEEFAKELHDQLKTLGLEKVFGLRRVGNLGSSYETTARGVRANVTQYGDIPADMKKEEFVRVLFRFDENGHARSSQFCIVHTGTCHHCGSHCSHNA